MQVILKPTTACNGTCIYCAAGSTLEGQPSLPAERLGALFEPLAAWMRQDPSRTLGIIWHGGEPMLPGVSYYERAREEQRRAFGDDLHRVRNRIQTNLTMLTEEWIPLLQDFFGGAVGTSYDMVDGVRGLRSGEALGPRWIRAVRLCLEADVRIGVLYVIHRLSLPRPRQIYRFFHNLDPGVRVRFNPLYREGRGADPEVQDLAIDPEEFGRFLVEVCDEWWPERTMTAVMPLTEWYQGWQGRLDLLCCDSGGVCQETHLGICPDGSTYGCGRASDSLDPELRLGNIFTDDLTAMLDHPARRQFELRGPQLRSTQCGDCPYWSVCHGGCPMVARLYHGDVMRETYFCEGRKMVFDYFGEHLGPPPAAEGVFGGQAVEDLS